MLAERPNSAGQNAGSPFTCPPGIAIMMSFACKSTLVAGFIATSATEAGVSRVVHSNVREKEGEGWRGYTEWCRRGRARQCRAAVGQHLVLLAVNSWLWCEGSHTQGLYARQDRILWALATERNACLAH
jgi:hypothetical protein